MNDAQFDQAMKEMDIEMAKLKKIMEASRNFRFGAERVLATTLIR
jgi:hypothetical protein